MAAEEKLSEIEGYKKEGKIYGWNGSFDELNHFAFDKLGVSWQNALKAMNLKGDELVLDFGAGRCWASYAFSKMGYHIVALDMNTDNVVGLGAGTTLTKEGGVFFERVGGDCEKTPFKDGSFDVIFGHQVLHHATELEKMLDEIARMLKKGGLLVITGEHKRGLFRSEKKWQSKNISVSFEANEHLYSYRDYNEALRAAGFKEVNICETKGYDSLKETITRSPSKTKMALLIKALVKLPIVGNVISSKIAYKLLLLLFTFDIRIIAKKMI